MDAPKRASKSQKISPVSRGGKWSVPIVKSICRGIAVVIRNNLKSISNALFFSFILSYRFNILDVCRVWYSLISVQRECIHKRHEIVISWHYDLAQSTLKGLQCSHNCICWSILFLSNSSMKINHLITVLCFCQLLTPRHGSVAKAFYPLILSLHKTCSVCQQSQLS